MTNTDVAGKTVKDLMAAYDWGVVFWANPANRRRSDARRGDIEWMATADTVLDLGDCIRVIAGLILGTAGRTGPLVWYLPYNANMHLRQLGLVLFFCRRRHKSWPYLLQHADGGAGPGLLIFGSRALITCATAFTALWTGYKGLKIPMGTLARMLVRPVAGLHRQPALKLCSSAGEKRRSESRLRHDFSDGDDRQGHPRPASPALALIPRDVRLLRSPLDTSFSASVLTNSALMNHDTPNMSSAVDWDKRFGAFLNEQMDEADAAHDRAHVRRVVETARRLAEAEGADLDIVLPASWLHDCVALAKDDPARDQASRRAADVAVQFLADTGYPPSTHGAIRHAIEAHSFSAGIEPRTLEAAVVQDADRLDALGAVGLARCFMVGGSLGSRLYHVDDPFCDQRDPDDSTYIIDHFYEKLLRLPKTMKTTAGQKEGERRAQFLNLYLDQLRDEIQA